ncbi:A/G-specific adenine glycosylase [Rhodothermus marinus]|uniref:A/G-specific adenine glycosylase n=1 Tax=Rhodothermus marinus TaxID=29549 RepID=UPI0012BA4F51|nr:A/G-specific adenine glycosylase [Rhodothermus marinus]BBM70246.1 A/G-specific adenine glycosylase [Rhodothermus marinus]BBM73233.1 A/G-specific adenine glycosylase [Rhodothermus marinus]
MSRRASSRSYLGRLTPALRETFHGLIDWYRRHARDLPWRRTRDPYRIWVAEVMLQQTRVDQAGPYYERFLSAFPTVEALAAASLDDVLRCWEGLGYYARARNLHRAARQLVAEHGGRLPTTYEALRRLPGVGPYTAAAVASIAFGEPRAVLDGNVIRVLTRVLAVADDARASATRRALQEVADALISAEEPGTFNQALMELGATVCTPVQPRCSECPLREVCRAWAMGDPMAFPVQTPRAPVPHYEVALGLLFNEEGAVLIQRRPEDGLLGGLWEFPGGKREPGESLEAACARELHEELGVRVAVGPCLATVRHAYTHFRVTLYAFPCTLLEGMPRSRAGLPLRWVPLNELDHYAFPRANRRLIELLKQRRLQPDLFGQHPVR